MTTIYNQAKIAPSRIQAPPKKSASKPNAPSQDDACFERGYN